MIKIIFLILGFVSLTLGVVGAFVPFLPTVPFLLLATFCFGKGSPRLTARFLNTKLYKNHVAPFLAPRTISKGKKMFIIFSFGFAMAITFIMFQNPTVRIILVVIFCVHSTIVSIKYKVTDETKKLLGNSRELGD